MTTALPVDTDFTGSTRTEGQAKTFIASLRAYLADLFGTTGTVATFLATLKLLGSTRLNNTKLTFSIGANALTATLKSIDETAFSSTNVGFVGQRSATLADGGANVRAISANISTVISAGSTAGLTSGVSGYLHYYLIDNVGTIELAWSGSFWGSAGIAGSTTAEGGAGAADSGTVMYSTTARTNVPYRWIAVVKAVNTTGNWTAVPTEVHMAPKVLTQELLVDTTPDGAADYVMTWDASLGMFRKVLLNTLVDHPSTAKWWGKFGVAGDVVASYNVTGVADTGTGEATVTIATDFSSVDWVPFVTCAQTGAARTPGVNSQAAGTVILRSRDAGGTLADPASHYFAGGLGDQ